MAQRARFDAIEMHSQKREVGQLAQAHRVGFGDVHGTLARGDQFAQPGEVTHLLQAGIVAQPPVWINETVEVIGIEQRDRCEIGQVIGPQQVQQSISRHYYIALALTQLFDDAADGVSTVPVKSPRDRSFGK